MNYIVGIDGGGTKTTLEIRSLQNELVKRKDFGAFNINSTGEAVFEKLLTELCKELDPIKDCRCLCIGAAGISNPKVHQMIAEALHKYGFEGSLLLKGDHEIALQGAFGKAEGIILISGTGSICYGRGRDGSIIRAGGWGHIIDDGGSAYAIARDAFSAVVQSCDGRRGGTLLKEYLFQQLRIQKVEELVPFLHHPLTDKGAIAAFAPVVEKAAAEGDAAAQGIINRNAGLLLELLKAVAKKLEQPLSKVALLGGMLSHPTILRQRVIHGINSYGSGLEYTEALGDAVDGAVAMALETAGEQR